MDIIIIFGSWILCSLFLFILLDLLMINLNSVTIILFLIAWQLGLGSCNFSLRINIIRLANFDRWKVYRGYHTMILSLLLLLSWNVRIFLTIGLSFLQWSKSFFQNLEAFIIHFICLKLRCIWLDTLLLLI